MKTPTKPDTAPPPVPPGSPILLRQEQTIAGPLPPPEDLQLYEKLLPGIADRLMALVEAEQRERFKLEEERLRADSGNSRMLYRLSMAGQIVAFASVLALASGAVVCARMGSPAVGVALAGTTIAGVVTAFLRRGKRQQ